VSKKVRPEDLLRLAIEASPELRAVMALVDSIFDEEPLPPPSPPPQPPVRRVRKARRRFIAPPTDDDPNVIETEGYEVSRTTKK
jgi:hypothetical protein